MSRYSKIKQEEYDSILIDILENITVSELLDIPGVYEAVSEEYNNEVLKIWEEQQWAEQEED